LLERPIRRWRRRASRSGPPGGPVTPQWTAPVRTRHSVSQCNPGIALFGSASRRWGSPPLSPVRRDDRHCASRRGPDAFIARTDGHYIAEKRMRVDVKAVCKVVASKRYGKYLTLDAQSRPIRSSTVSPTGRETLSSSISERTRVLRTQARRSTSPWIASASTRHGARRRGLSLI